MESMYKREQALRARGMGVRRANHFEQQMTEYGEKLIWVIDRGERQALKAFATKAQAISAAELYEAT